MIDSGLGGVPREQKMLKGHLPRVIYHQVCYYTKIKRRSLVWTFALEHERGGGLEDDDLTVDAFSKRFGADHLNISRGWVSMIFFFFFINLQPLESDQVLTTHRSPSTVNRDPLQTS